MPIVYVPYLDFPILQVFVGQHFKGSISGENGQEFGCLDNDVGTIFAFVLNLSLYEWHVTQKSSADV